MIENKVFNNQTPSVRRVMLSVLVVLMVAVSMPVQAKLRYVSDELQIPLRSGASNGHRIVSFLKSGTALTVLAASDDDKFIEVETGDGKTGWVAAKDVIDIPSGRDRLAATKKKFANTSKTIDDLENTIAEMKSEIKQLKNEKGSLQSERTNLNNSLDDLKITAANPLALSKKNKALKKELDQVRDSEAMLEKENQQLRSNVMQEWFMIGGSVSIGSLILGLLLTRINWRRKRSSWGDNF